MSGTVVFVRTGDDPLKELHPSMEVAIQSLQTTLRRHQQSMGNRVDEVGGSAKTHHYWVISSIGHVVGEYWIEE